MKCLIIAAGRGDRLREFKPLVNLLGLPLIERVILSAKKGGCTEFSVVVGYKMGELSEFLEELSVRRNLKIEIIENERWQEENGMSVLCAEGVMKERFILVMADHLFDPDIIRELSREEIEDGVILAVDKNLDNRFVDLGDVTKVMIRDNRITDIGKGISEYNGYDTGIFLCTPAIFLAIKESIERGDSTLSGGIKVLAKENKVFVFDIKDRFWIDIDNKSALKEAEKALTRNLAKPTDGFISKSINRHFSAKLFTPLFLKIHKNITPNQASFISFSVAVIAALFFFFGKGVVGGLLTQLSSILDGTDGEIARLKDMESSLGNFVDAILDRYADGFILFGMFYYSLVEMKGSFSPLLITGISGLAILGNIMVSYTSAKSVVNFGYRYKGRWIGAGRGRDLRLFLIFAGGVVSSIHPVAVLFALGTVAALTNIVVVWRVSLSASLKNRLYERIKAVIFDFDGTVADTMGFLTQLATELISENYNISKDEAKKRYLETTGAEFASQIETIFPSHPKNREVVELFEAKKEEDIFEHPIFPEAVSVLEYFQKKQIKSFICSSTKQEIITKYCNLYNIGHLVTDLFGQKEGFGKREQIEFILSHYGLEPEDMLFVGDSLKDYEFTKKKGIRFIGITRIFTKKRFKEKGAQSVDSLREVVKLFEL